jgi:hypothetical protein
MTAWGSLPIQRHSCGVRLQAGFFHAVKWTLRSGRTVRARACSQSPGRLAQVLKDRRLASVSVETRIYRCRMPTRSRRVGQSVVTGETLSSGNHWRLEADPPAGQ